MAMSRKHYRRVAGMIKQARSESRWHGDMDWIIRGIETQLALMFKEDNHNFNEVVFHAACEPEPQQPCDKQ